MTLLPKICLAVSTAGFVAGGIIDFGGFNVVPAMTVALPLGAVFFGVFIIALMMEKEMAKFDEETTKKLQSIQSVSELVAPARQNRGIDRNHHFSQTVPVSAHDH